MRDDWRNAAAPSGALMAARSVVADRPRSPPLPGQSPTSRTYRPDIDGLRAIAVTSVLLFHCGVPGFSGGYVGVDVFFVISGYLITGHLAADIAAGRLSILQFYERRVRRIVPALIVMLVATWAIAACLLLPSYLVAASEAMLAAAASVSNIYLWRESNYFDADSTLQPFLHTWSLSVEEQFYLFIPLLMKLSARWLRGRWGLLFGPLCLASFALSIHATTTAPTANFYLLPTRAWELGLGSLLATTSLPAITRRLTAELAGAAALLLLLVPVFLFDDATPFPGLNALYPCVGAALLIHVGHRARPAATMLLSTRPFVAIGLISYSLYLVHWPIVSLLRYWTLGPPGAGQIAAMLAASVILATLSWRFVERPFRRATPRLSQRRVIAGGLAAIAATCLIGAAGVAGGGFPGRFPDFVETRIPGHAAWAPGRCFLLGDPDYHKWSLGDCTVIATGPRKVLLWGDSFAGQYVPGIRANASRLAATVIEYTAAGCPPVLSYRSYARVLCPAFNAHALDIIREQKIDTVLLTARWTELQQRGFDGIASTLDALDRLGVRTVVLGQSPQFVTDVQVIAFLKGSRSADAVNRWPVFFAPAINTALAAVAGRHRFIDPMPAFCSGALCTYQDHGTYLFEDYGHYSIAGSDRAVQWLLRQPDAL